ncbi:MAG: DEAD/DEAH box helicase [Marinovum sp.]|nr:DEAD/DEAH box helicase [Marinovum sp.]
MKSFEELALTPSLAAALARGSFAVPTPIQAQAIPLALSGQDIMGLAQTGTGKTLAFSIPMLDAIIKQPGRPAPKSVKALILAPTRELVNQIVQTLKFLTENTKVRVSTVVGGASIGKQLQVLAHGTDVLVATPGRLIDLLERGGVDLSKTRHLVLDEADQMLDIGFIHALRKIVPFLSNDRQTLLFSATMSKQMEKLSRSYLTNPQKVQVNPPNLTADRIEQSVLFVEKPSKPSTLRDILEQYANVATLIFTRTKHGAEKLKKGLVADGFAATSVHGNKSQGQRNRAIEQFRSGEVQILVATDVAARGIDIPTVGLVVNYDLPNVPENYVHRIGRTARAGRSGVAITLCAFEESKLLRDVEKLIKTSIHIEGAAPKTNQDLRVDVQNPKATKPKRRRRRTKHKTHQSDKQAPSNRPRQHNPGPNKTAA